MPRLRGCALIYHRIRHTLISSVDVIYGALRLATLLPSHGNLGAGDESQAVFDSPYDQVT